MKSKDQRKPLLLHVVTVPSTLLAFFTGQIEYLKERGFTVAAVSSPGPEAEMVERRDGIKIYQVQMLRRISPIADIIALFRLFRIMNELQPTIVHAHTPKGGLLGIIAARLARVPICAFTLHGIRSAEMTGIKKLLCSSGDKISCWLAHRIFAVSNSLCREVLKRGYCNEEKIKVLANGSFNGLDAKMRFNPEEYPRETRALLRRKYGIPEDAIVLGYIGRIVRDKGIIELTQAWTRLRAEFKNLYLLMVGDFEAGDSVGREVYEALKNDDRVFITGFIYNNIPEHYIAMDIVVLPTYREGLGYTILEGSAMRLPVVATKVCGCVDVVEDGKTGLLVPPKNEKALYEAIKKMSLDESLRDRLGRAGRQRVLECFTQELIWETLFKEYLSLMKKRNLQFPS